MLALVGPTASGKSELGIQLAEKLGAPILSVDSMQVYREMDIGTAKPSPAEQRRVPHYMIDLVDPEEAFSVARFQREARKIIESDEHPMVFIVGGSGLHFRAVVDPLTFPPHDSRARAGAEATQDPVADLLEVDPGAGVVVDLDNRRRVVRALEIFRLTGQTPSMRSQAAEAEAIRSYKPFYEFRAVGIDPADELISRIDARTNAMADRGLIEEVETLAARLGATARNAVGYRQLLAVVAGEITAEAGLESVKRATLALARRQRTFFRRDPRIAWLPWSASPRQRLADVRSALGL